jgi:hypothetical protein
MVEYFETDYRLFFLGSIGLGCPNVAVYTCTIPVMGGGLGEQAHLACHLQGPNQKSQERRSGTKRHLQSEASLWEWRDRSQDWDRDRAWDRNRKGLLALAQGWLGWVGMG